MAVWIVNANTETGMLRYEVHDENGNYAGVGIAMRANPDWRDYHNAARATRANVIRRLGDEKPVFAYRDESARAFVEMLNA